MQRNFSAINNSK